MTFSGRYRYRYFKIFLADTDIDNQYINLLATKFCHYFSTNFTLKASLIPIQRKTIANTSHTPVLFIKKTNKKHNDLAINSLERLCLLSKLNSLR